MLTYQYALLNTTPTVALQRILKVGKKQQTNFSIIVKQHTKKKII